MITVTRPGGASAPDGLLLDLREWYGPKKSTGSSNTGWQARGGILIAASQLSWFNNGSASGAGGSSSEYIDRLGQAYRVISNAAGGIVRRADAMMFPLWQDFSLFPADFTARHRFTLTALVAVESLPTNAQPFIGLHMDGGFLGAASGIDLGFNAGGSNTWRVRSVLTPGAAITLGNTTTVGAGTYCTVSFEYTEGDPPELVVSVNGEALQTFTGIANLPVPGALPFFATSSQGGIVACFGSAGEVSDGPLLVRRVRYTVEELAA